MPKVLKSLTNTEIAAAKPQKTEYMLRDGDGLALLIKPSGRKIWYFEYTPPALKKRTKISIGPYPVVTLAMARDFRLQYRRLLVQGIDPQAHLEQVAEEQRLQNECTLEKVAEQWLKEKKRTSDLSEDHAKDVWRSLEMHVFPSLSNTPVTEIRPKMLCQVAQALNPASQGISDAVGSLLLRKPVPTRAGWYRVSYRRSVSLLSRRPAHHAEPNLNSPLPAHRYYSARHSFRSPMHSPLTGKYCYHIGRRRQHVTTGAGHFSTYPTE